MIEKNLDSETSIKRSLATLNRWRGDGDLREASTSLNACKNKSKAQLLRHEQRRVAGLSHHPALGLIHSPEFCKAQRQRLLGNKLAAGSKGQVGFKHSKERRDNNRAGQRKRHLIRIEVESLLRTQSLPNGVTLPSKKAGSIDFWQNLLSLLKDESYAK